MCKKILIRQVAFHLADEAVERAAHHILVPLLLHAPLPQLLRVLLPPFRGLHLYCQPVVWAGRAEQEQVGRPGNHPLSFGYARL